MNGKVQATGVNICRFRCFMYISVLQYCKLSECNDVIINIHLNNLRHTKFCLLGSCELVNGDNEENDYHHGEFNNIYVIVK